jgi:VanZ family protein
MMFSYGVEFLQFFIPERDSGWEDVFTNGSGSLVGSLVFAAVGQIALRVACAIENGLRSIFVAWRPVLVLLIYFGLWFVVSVPLQKETRLTSWNPDSLLVVGNDATPASPWSGQVRLLQIWDRAISNEEASALHAGGSLEAAGPLPRASYDFSPPSPFHDQLNLLPDLVWTPHTPPQEGAHSAVLRGADWLTSRVPVQQLVQDFRKSNQFSIRVVCAPAQAGGTDGRIVSLSEPSGVVNFSLRQENANLVFWFRNSTSLKRSQMHWYLPDVFKLPQMRDIVYSYDGSNLSIHLDGKLHLPVYRLGPGRGLALFVRKVKGSETNGYNALYYILLFFPAGVLLGLAINSFTRYRPAGIFSLALVFLLAPVLIEVTLVSVSGRAFSFANIAISICIAVCGTLWIQSDRWPVKIG